MISGVYPCTISKGDLPIDDGCVEAINGLMLEQKIPQYAHNLLGEQLLTVC